MTNKIKLITSLEGEFRRWGELKDILAHLMSWQQVSIARLEAAKK